LWNPVTSGVPQGSVLGPLLFIVYVDDMEDGLLNKLLKFADDTKLFGKVKDEGEYRSLQEDLMKLSRWSEKWMMPFNVEKCKVMHFSTSTGSVARQYFLQGKALEAVNEERDLGVVIRSDLKSSAQCIAAYNKASSKLELINRTIQSKNSSILLNLYKSLVRPLVEYGMSAWSPHFVKDKELIERIQHRFTRMIPGMKNLEYTRRLKLLNLWTLEERRNYRADLIKLYKMFTGLSDLSVKTFFEVVSESVTRGHNLKIRKKYSSVGARKFFSERRRTSGGTC
jgi:hypothetical protein